MIFKEYCQEIRYVSINAERKVRIFEMDNEENVEKNMNNLEWNCFD
jgi:hypothetical protein